MTWARWVAGPMVGLLLGAMLAEGLIRVLDPPPRTPVVRADRVPGFRVLDGVPVWGRPRAAGTAFGCPDDVGEDETVVVLAGSSILYGAGIDDADVLTVDLALALRERLDGPVCVENVAQSAMAGAQKVALATEQLDRLPVDTVVLEVWQIDPGRMTVLDGDAYYLERHRRKADGYPDAFGLPMAWNRALFRASRLYAYGSLALAEADVDPGAGALWSSYLRRSLEPLLARVRSEGAELVLVAFPPLHRSFAESAADPFPGYAVVRAWAEREGVRYVDIASELTGEDHEALRVDACCHYAPEGHDRLAELLADVLAPEAGTAP